MEPDLEQAAVFVVAHGVEVGRGQRGPVHVTIQCAAGDQYRPERVSLAVPLPGLGASPSGRLLFATGGGFVRRFLVGLDFFATEVLLRGCETGIATDGLSLRHERVVGRRLR